VERRGVEAGDVSDPNLPKLKFSVTTSMGWLEFSDHVNRGRIADLPEPAEH